MSEIVTVRVASDSDVEACVKLENLLSVDHPAATERGFLRANATAEIYKQFLNSEILYIAECGARFAGFLVVLHSKSVRLEVLRSQSQSFQTSRPDLFQLPNLMWCAKVGVLPDFMRRGIGSKLYHHLFTEFNNFNFATTTASVPISNAPSLRFHEAHGFKRIGEYHVGDGLTVHDLLLRENGNGY